MVLRNSISNTRKLFQKTIDNFKSLFSNNGTYQKLPKTPNNTSINNHHPNPNIITSSSSIQKQFQPKPRHYVTKNRGLIQQPRRRDRDETTLFTKPKVELVHQKLKEMEMMMNDDMMINEEHFSDVREFLHCYSRLRYTAYLDVVEQFFMEVYSDFFSFQPLEHTVRSRCPTVVGLGSYGGHKH
ncbi:hypothetical protein AALP_AA3G285900 [Arabis alpina]|uniref:OVATE domain-containing protein n=1 Tax=Arabis alpina TaxID=50452 RepID=A0A087HCC2_ARAAL|nr:hypothetical protein AALP_AA3G285900 [Arabis alpina]